MKPAKIALEIDRRDIFGFLANICNTSMKHWYYWKIEPNQTLFLFGVTRVSAPLIPARDPEIIKYFFKWIQQALDIQVSSRLDWRDPACSSRPCFRSWRRRGSRWRRGTPRSRCRGLSKLPAQKSEEKITAMFFSKSTTISALPWGLRVTSLDPSHHLSNKLFLCGSQCRLSHSHAA